MKTRTMSFAEWRSFRPDNADRSAWMAKPGYDGDMIVKTWPSRVAMLRAIDKQRDQQERLGQRDNPKWIAYL